ncbi:hypothetical protein [Priestia megaterium]|uniref:hypothetical protein n=1 Tax=Priestia megaterium TaxID=1404 RepID=UPI001C21077B|nr:hypothetical protein [Priestia megaterium]MBU8689500.1 hypothetical protein [Priestia megaterium]
MITVEQYMKKKIAELENEIKQSNSLIKQTIKLLFKWKTLKKSFGEGKFIRDLVSLINIIKSRREYIKNAKKMINTFIRKSTDASFIEKMIRLDKEYSRYHEEVDLLSLCGHELTFEEAREMKKFQMVDYGL